MVVIATIALVRGRPARCRRSRGARPPPPSASAASSTNVKVIVTFKAKPGTAARSAVRGFGGKVGRSLGLIRSLSATVPSSKLAALRANPLVKSVEIDGDCRHSTRPPATSSTTTPGASGTSARTRSTSGHHGRRASRSPSSTPGIDYIHDDPAQPHVVDPEFLDIYKGGYDFVNNDADPMDDNGHGTHVAGHPRRREQRLPRRRRRARRRPVRAQGPRRDGSGDYSGLIAALGWAVDHDIDVVNMSLGGHERLGGAAGGRRRPRTTRACTLVAASGNVDRPSTR